MPFLADRIGCPIKAAGTSSQHDGAIGS